MATSEQEIAQRKKLADILAKLSSIKPEDLAREDMLGKSLSFAEGITSFSRALQLFRELNEIDLNLLPFNRLVSLFNVANQAFNQFESIRNFNVDQNPQNPKAVRDSLISQIQDLYDSWFEAISPTLAYSVRKGTDV